MKNEVFCTVNSGTNIFTNITIKSILKFHPTAHIFVIDTLVSGKDPFEPIEDDIMKNTEVIVGIDRKKTTLPTIDIMQAKNLTDEQKEIAIAKLGSNPYTIKFRGSFNHSENIQFAINTIDQNFILVDSDAPLIKPIDFDIQSDCITIAEIKSLNAVKNGYSLLSPTFNKFLPFVQFINVNEMKNKGIIYYDPYKLIDMLDLAIVQNQSLWFDTGCILYDQVVKNGLPFAEIKCSDYVDHFVSASYCRTKPVEFFYRKYSSLFKKDICLMQ